VSNKKSLILLIFLLLALASTLGLVARITIFSGKATSSNTSPIALQNSYLFASPLQAKADSKEKLRITVFILDGRGIGIANKTVSLSLPQTISISDVQPITDDSGKAVFDLSTPVAQKTEVMAKIDNQAIPQKVRVVFY